MHGLVNKSMWNQSHLLIQLVVHYPSFQIIQFNQKFKKQHEFTLQLILQQTNKKMN